MAFLFSLGLWWAIWLTVSSLRQRRDMAMDADYVNKISDPGSSEEVSVEYYRTAAARARRLQADATTPRLKQYLGEVIARCELLAGEVERASGED